MGQVDASIAQLLLPVLEQDFQSPVSLVSWLALANLQDRAHQALRQRTFFGTQTIC